MGINICKGPAIKGLPMLSFITSLQYVKETIFIFIFPLINNIITYNKKKYYRQETNNDLPPHKATPRILMKGGIK